VRKRKGLLFAVVLALVLLTDYYLVGLSIVAFGWHMRHGFHREVHGFRFNVPLFYEEGDGVKANSFSIYSYACPFRKKSSGINIDFPPWSSDKTLTPMSKDYAQRMGLGLLGQRSARFANRTGRCIEYLQQGVPTLSLGRTNMEPTWITCQFGDVSANFDGTHNAVPEFYQFLESAQEVKR
jgi:hypothetical protein